MKKRKLKSWVRYVLGVIFIISILVSGSDSQDTKTFMITHIIAGIMLLVSGTLLVKNK